MELTKFEPDGYYTRIRGMDPSANWLLGPGIEDYLPEGELTLIPFIMNLHDEKGFNVVIGFLGKGDDNGPPGPPILIPSLYAEKLEIGKYFTAFARKEFFDELAKEDSKYGELRDAKKEIKLCAPLKASSMPHWAPGEPPPVTEKPPIKPLPPGLKEKPVVIGIIDDGIAFAHERFRRAVSATPTTRVECFWRQDGPYLAAGSTVIYGSEICKGDIDTLLATSVVAGSVDEETLYLRAGLIDFAEPGHKAAAWRASHGTHILDIAAGEDPADNVDNRPIVCVQLPIATTADSSGSDLTDKVLNGIDYILDRVDALAMDDNPLPVVINISYGIIAGPHDGTSALERGIDDRILARPDKLKIILPAGNSHLSRCHAEVKFNGEGEVVQLSWRVQPDDQTPNFLQIWLPHEGALPLGTSRIGLSVVTPGGVETPMLVETHGTGVHVINNGQVICAASYVFNNFPTERGVFLVELQPTRRLYPTTPPELADKIAPSGVWTVKLHNLKLGTEESVHAWIQRDDTIYGYPLRGRQSYFDQPCYARFDAQGQEIEEDAHAEQPACHIKRASLINPIATGAKPIVAGGFLRKDLRLAKYSAGGPITPTRDETITILNLRKPDAVLVSDDSKVHFGVLAAGARSGSVVAMSGTSVAAPGLARLVADRVGDSLAADRDDIKVVAQTHEAAHPVPKPPLPPDRGGWGRILLPPIVPLPRYWD